MKRSEYKKAEDYIEMIRSMVRAGRKDADIAAVIGVRRQRIQEWRIRFDIPRRDLARVWTPEKDKILADMAARGASVAEMGAAVEQSQQSVYARLAALKIKRRRAAAPKPQKAAPPAPDSVFARAIGRLSYADDVRTVVTGKMPRPEPALRNQSQMAGMVGEGAE